MSPGIFLWWHCLLFYRKLFSKDWRQTNGSSQFLIYWEANVAVKTHPRRDLGQTSVASTKQSKLPLSLLSKNSEYWIEINFLWNYESTFQVSIISNIGSSRNIRNGMFLKRNTKKEKKLLLFCWLICFSLLGLVMGASILSKFWQTAQSSFLFALVKNVLKA